MSVADISLNQPGWYCKGYTTDASASVVLQAWFEGNKTFSDIIEKINQTIFRLDGVPIVNLEAIDNSNWESIYIGTNGNLGLEKGIYWIQVK